MAWALPSTSRSAWMVQSRHPGRYPKLRSLTLSYPAFEPLTEHHAFSTGLSTAASKSRACPRCPTMLSVCRKQHDKPNGDPKLQTFLILPHSIGRLQDEPTTGSINHRSTANGDRASCGGNPDGRGRFRRDQTRDPGFSEGAAGCIRVKRRCNSPTQGGLCFWRAGCHRNLQRVAARLGVEHT